MIPEALPCPLCESTNLSYYLSVSREALSCVCCLDCKYYNTVQGWNKGDDPNGWDSKFIKRIRQLEDRIIANRKRKWSLLLLR
jgi:hypothetical protein